MILKECLAMRIVAGKYRHRQIIYPDDALHIRPTKDRIREALFSSLGDISSLTILDLYAGSGAMGIEALSRGAKSATFVDNNKIAINTVKQNIKNLEIDNVEIIFKNDYEALESLINQKKSFDLIILDPPYQKGDYLGVIKTILDNSLLNSGGRIVTECDHELDFSSFHYQKIKSYHYGEIKVNVLYF